MNKKEVLDIILEDNKNSHKKVFLSHDGKTIKVGMYFANITVIDFSEPCKLLSGVEVEEYVRYNIINPYNKTYFYFIYKIDYENKIAFLLHNYIIDYNVYSDLYDEEVLDFDKRISNLKEIKENLREHYRNENKLSYYIKIDIEREEEEQRIRKENIEKAEKDYDLIRDMFINGYSLDLILERTQYIEDYKVKSIYNSFKRQVEKNIF